MNWFENLVGDDCFGIAKERIYLIKFFTQWNVPTLIFFQNERWRLIGVDVRWAVNQIKIARFLEQKHLLWYFLWGIARKLQKMSWWDDDPSRVVWYFTIQLRKKQHAGGWKNSKNAWENISQYFMVVFFFL